MSLTHSDIADILRAIDASSLDEVVVQVGDVRVEVRRRGAVSAMAAPPAPTGPTAAPLTAPATPVSAAPAAPRSSPPDTTDTGPVVEPGQVAVRSPMVGTFFRRPSPDAAPFVEVGSEVGPESPLCLLEVMKLYTTVYAGSAGRVAAICVEDAELVEYDQILLVIETG